MSANFGNGEVLMPTVGPNGQPMSPEQAMQLYRQSGQHLGIFDTPANADTYADWLHHQQARMYGDGSQ